MLPPYGSGAALLRTTSSMSRRSAADDFELAAAPQLAAELSTALPFEPSNLLRTTTNQSRRSSALAPVNETGLQHYASDAALLPGSPQMAPLRE